MAETVTIEIPIEAVDRTQTGVQSATKSLTAFEQSMERTMRRLTQMEARRHNIDLELNDNASDRMSDVEDQAQILDGMNPDIDVEVNNAATEALQDVADQAEMLDGTASDVDVGANDTATGVLGDVGDRTEAVDGMSADVDVGANDSATPVISSASDAVEAFDGQSGSADIGVNDDATPVVSAARDEVESFSGSSGEADIGANDNASPVLDSVRDKAEAWSGSVWNATVGIVDAATAPLTSIMNAAKNPITQAGAMLGISVGLNDTVNTYKSFESMMSQVQAISGATGSDLEALTAKAKEMGATTKFTATESAEAMNYMAMAGWKTQDMVSGISGIMNLAAASGEDLGTTSDIVTDALTAFGLQASDSTHFADVLAQASSNANTNVSMLGESFKYVAPVAGAMNYSVEDTSLALGLMANASVKGSMAGTALKTSLANLASPTDSMAEAMEKYGISLTDNEGNMKSLGDVIKNLRSSLGGLSETEQTAAASTIFGKEAMAGMLAIINASEEDYNKLSDAIYNADGAAEQMSDTMLDNLEGSLTLMQSAVDGVKTSFGERLSPYIQGVAEAITAAMPGAESALTELMDFVDGKASGLKRTIDEMKDSAEWEDADLFGKVNIAWDKIVAEPFTKWASSKGKNLLSKGLSSLFSDAAKILPGGEEAGLTSWLSAGIIAKGTTTLISSAGSVVSALAPIGSAIKEIGTAAATAPSLGAFVSDLSGMIGTAGKAGLAAAAIAAAVAAIAVAVNNYTQSMKEADLADHFGQITLSAKEAEEAASGILNAKYLVNVELALGEIENADQLRETAEKALESNQVLTWKSSVGIELTADEQSEYTDNITTFIDSKISELESRSFAAHISVQTFLGGTEAGDTLASSIEEWARADNLELTDLSNDLKTAVENALQDGIIDVDEAQAVAALQEKINSITSQWKQAESQAQLDWINQEYGSLSGKDLTSDSFESVVEALSSQRDAAAEETQALATEFYSYLNAAEASGRITGAQNTQYKEMAGQAIRNQQANDLMTSMGFEMNTLNSTYGDALQKNYDKTADAMSKQLKNLSSYAQNDDITSLFDSFQLGSSVTQQGGGWQWTQNATQNNLDDLWKTMQPDASAMQNLIDEYVNTGQEIPRAVKDSFNEAMQIGAASGDTDAAWQVYANSLAESGDKALIDAISNMDANGQLPEELSAAWKRATASVTDDPVELSGLKASVDGDVEIDKDAWVESLNEKLGDLATTEEVTAEGATIKVEAGDCLWSIGNALGVDWQTIAEENGIESPYIIHAGDELKISMDTLTAEVDADAANDAIEQAMAALTAEGAEFTVAADGVKVDLTNVQVDSETAMAQIEAALGIESGALGSSGIAVETGASVTIPSDLVTVDTSGIETAVEQDQATGSTTMSTDVTVEASSVDATSAKEAADTATDAAFSETYDTTGSADVTIEQTNNADSVYDAVGSDLTSKFSSPYSLNASAVVTIAWSIANPSKSISFSGSGSGSVASVNAAFNASGGAVGQNGAELSWVGEEGLEYIIPTVPGRRGRGIALWEQAGQALGVLDSDGQISAHAGGGIVGPSGEVQADDSIIPLVPDDAKEEQQSIWSVTGQQLGAGTSEDSSDGNKGTYSVNAQSGQQNSGNNIEIKVDMSPVIKIEGDGMDEQKIFEIMLSRCREMADELSDEIAERMGKIFDNMPLVQEA